MKNMVRSIPRPTPPMRSFVGRIRPSLRPYAQVIEEARTIAGTTTVTGYVYGDALLAQRADGVSRYYQYDGFGSARALTDSAGSVVDRYTYDAYGKLLDSRGSTINPYRYRGEQYEPALDAYYLRARYYQPDTVRFLTTDSFEGAPTMPMSLHRYLYGNSDPVNFIDSSGKMSLSEKLVTAGVVGNLTMTALSFTNFGQHFFTELAKNVFPEAYILGFNVIGKLPFPLSLFLQDISYEFSDLWPSPPTVDNYSIVDFPYLHGTVGAGREYLLSVGSSEIALFMTRTLGGTLTLPTLAFGFELYDGFVYNLWNANDYTGPFGSISVNWGKNKPGLTLFWDAIRGFNGGIEGNGGPWGGASTIFSKSAFLSWDFGATWSNINYTPVGKPKERCRSEIISRICKAILVTKAIEAMTRISLVPAAFSILEITTWMNIGIAHNAWNQHEPEYNIRARRRDPRPDKYHSGPYHWVF